MSESQRVEWIDFAKGVGIILVAAGHVFSGAYSGYGSWFYMPLFFFLSGYLYKDSAPFIPFAVKRVKHLLVPYASFIVGLGIVVYLSYRLLTPDPDTSLRYIAEYIWRLIYGGKALGGVFGYLGRPFGIMWFLTCLFATQLLYHAIHKRLGFSKTGMFLVMCGMYALAMIDGHNKFMAGAFNNWGLPWNINVAAFAIVFFYVGHQSANVKRSRFYERNAEVVDVGLLIFAITYLFAALILHSGKTLNPTMSVKFARYGVPVFNLFLSLSMIALTCRIGRAWSACGDPVKIIVMECGKASMVIMYAHSYIQLVMADYPATANPLMRFTFCLIFSYCLYRMFALFSPTRKLFLGDFR